ncbi:glycosyltransferase [Arthrobacter sp. AL08]|uniref:glycosyltransferase n=1 Tax=unclassified Arthrobacter TaxID=235627 RepID=UPI00249C8E74|nr:MULTISPECIES: glycosyltransferase [unclassified Arthrobacter]MDI3242679.1 glycosyltransferase [Arthrobacter sp. AL05]MDI3278589.1 glycosyltransferase [Arthrobacter sp. AL08]
MPSNDQPGRTAAVIAAYSPPESLVEAIRRLRGQLDHIVVVDDGSPADSAPVFARLAEQGATVLHQGTNQGIAVALNTGIRTASEKWAPEFFLTLDQDSLVTDRYVELAHRTYADAKAKGLDVAFVCAASYSGHAVPTIPSHDGFLHAFDPMQSGFVIPRSTIDRVGAFDEGLFIDGVDSEFTVRSRTAGLDVLVGAGCDIDHDLGQRRPGTLFGRQVRIGGTMLSYNYHSPGRVYYICRNGTILTKRYALKAPKWVARRLVEELKAHLLRFAFSPGRLTLLRAAARGFWDGAKGVSGRIPVELERRIR